MSLPIILLTLFALGILLIDLMMPREWKWTNAVTALVGVLFSAAGVVKIQYALNAAGIPGESAFLHSMVVDHFSIYFCYLFLASAAISILMSVRYLEIEHENHGEFYALILFSVVGMMCMASGFDIVLIFIGLELMAISTYVLVGFLRTDRRSNEAALKYLLLGAFSSGIFAYGLSLFYGLTGSTSLVGIRRAGSHGCGPPESHRSHRGDRTADHGDRTVLQDCRHPFPPVAAGCLRRRAHQRHRIHVGSGKGGGLGDAAAHLPVGLYPLRTVYVPLLIFVSITTMTGANLAALTQNNLKRLLAYSSIAHVGYMLLGLVALASVNYPAPAFFDGFKGILLYLLVYTFMNLGAFAVITSLRQRNVIGDEMDDIAGLYFRAPTEAVLMLIFLLSLAGIPPLAGFYGKYFIFLSLMESGHYVLASLAVLYAVFGLYYYMRIANHVHERSFGQDAASHQRRHASGAGRNRVCYGLHRNLPRAIHPDCDLVVGHRPEHTSRRSDPERSDTVRPAVSGKDPALVAKPLETRLPKEKRLGATGELQPVGIRISGCHGCRMVDRRGARSLAAYDLAVSGRADPGHYCRIRRTDPHRHFLRFQMTGIETVIPAADSESFYSGALGRIPRLMIVLAVALTAAGWWRYGWRIALGFACGCAIAYLNFHWLERVIAALADRATGPAANARAAESCFDSWFATF